MGKTKTVVVSALPEETKSGEEKYKERQKKKQEKEKDKIRVPGLGGGQRVVAVSAEPVITESAEETTVDTEKKKEIGPRVRGRKYLKAKAKVDKNKAYKLDEAVNLVKETSYSKFDGTVELHLVVNKLGLSKSVTLPHKSGKDKKVIIANDETIKKLKDGKIDFDVLLATAEMMPKLVPFAKILGPKGLMPNPKNGTLIKREKDASSFSANTINLKTEKKQPIIHAVVGKVNQDDKELTENTETVLNAVGKKQILKAYIKSTMSPSIRILT